MKRVDTLRDLIILQNEGQYIISATDSCGGIGNNPGDVLQCPPKLVGIYTARVPLFEVMAAGAKPVFATIAVCNGQGTAEGLLLGVKQAFSYFSDFPLVISTEKNMQTCMTGLGVSVTGICACSDLRVKKAKAGDLLGCLGLPLCGEETLRQEESMLTFSAFSWLLKNPLVGSVLPVGSHGIKAEGLILAKESGLLAAFDPDCGIDLEKSAGPGSCAVFSCKEGFVNESGLPFFVIGKLK